MAITYATNGQAVQGYQTEIDIDDIVAIHDIPNRDLNKENLNAIASQLESLDDVRKFPPLHVAPMGRFGVENHEYPLINGFHRVHEYKYLYYAYCRDQGIDIDDDNAQLPVWKVPVIVRTDIVSREDVINARYADNAIHGFPPTSKDKREYALFLAENYKGELTQSEIARRCGLDKSTVGKLLKRVGRPKNEEGESERDGYSVLLENFALPLLKAAEKYFIKEKSIFGLFGFKPEKDQEKRVKLLMDTMREKQLSQTEIMRIHTISIAMYHATKTLLPDN